MGFEIWSNWIISQLVFRNCLQRPAGNGILGPANNPLLKWEAPRVPMILGSKGMYTYDTSLHINLYLTHTHACAYMKYIVLIMFITNLRKN